MFITMLKDVKWSIDFKAVSFTNGQYVDVKDDVANEMIKLGYAIQGRKEIKIETPEDKLIINNTSIQNNNIENPEKKLSHKKKGR